jgi:hypothetical protein
MFASPWKSGPSGSRTLVKIIKGFSPVVAVTRQTVFSRKLFRHVAKPAEKPPQHLILGGAALQRCDC